MSKYQQRGDYHFQLYKTKGDTYREHVLDVMEKVGKFMPPGCDVYDAGAGEGLITHLLIEAGYSATGCEIDGHAVELAAGRALPIEQVMFEEAPMISFGGIMFLDSLEHVDDFKAVIAKAQRMTDLLFIAIPDRHDPHATVQVTKQQIIDEFDGWQTVHDETRHARHFMIFEKAMNRTEEDGFSRFESVDPAGVDLEVEVEVEEAEDDDEPTGW